MNGKNIVLLVICVIGPHQDRPFVCISLLQKQNICLFECSFKCISSVHVACSADTAAACIVNVCFQSPWSFMYIQPLVCELLT